MSELVVFAVIWAAAAAILRLREPEASASQQPIPFCADCGSRFLTQRGLAWHRAAAHHEVNS